MKKIILFTILLLAGCILSATTLDYTTATASSYLYPMYSTHTVEGINDGNLYHDWSQRQGSAFSIACTDGSYLQLTFDQDYFISKIILYGVGDGTNGDIDYTVDVYVGNVAIAENIYIEGAGNVMFDFTYNVNNVVGDYVRLVYHTPNRASLAGFYVEGTSVSSIPEVSTIWFVMLSVCLAGILKRKK